MIDDDGHPDGLPAAATTRGSIYDIVDPAKDKAKKPIGEWNQSRVVVKDGKIEHYLNGKVSSSGRHEVRGMEGRDRQEQVQEQEGLRPRPGAS
jgi:hypothetical protein